MSRQPWEILNDAMKQIESAFPAPKPYVHVQPAKPVPLCQYELLLLAHPKLQSGGIHAKGEVSTMTQGWMTLDIHGTVRNGVIEDMRCEAKGEDIYHLLGDAILQEITRYVLDT